MHRRTAPRIIYNPIAQKTTGEFRPMNNWRARRNRLDIRLSSSIIIRHEHLRTANKKRMSLKQIDINRAK